MYQKTLTILCAVVLTGCAQTVNTVNRDQVQFNGDDHPRVTSSMLRDNVPLTLSAGETVLMASAADGSATLSSPDRAVLSLHERVLENQQMSRDMILARCDPDGDGQLDMYCPDLMNYQDSESLESQRYVNFRSWFHYSREEVAQNSQTYSNTVSVDLTEVDDEILETYLNFVALNVGNKAFEGNLKIVSMLPVRIESMDVLAIEKIGPNSAQQGGAALLDGLVMGLTGVPVAMFQARVDDYRELETNATINTVVSSDGREITIEAEGITIDEGEGLRVRFVPKYSMSKLL